MPTWVASLLAALWEILKPWVTPAASAVVGAKLQEGQDAKETLEKVDDASKAASDARGWSHADKLRYLQQRRLHRVLPERDGD